MLLINFTEQSMRTKKYFRVIVFLMLSPFLLMGCSDDDDDGDNNNSSSNDVEFSVSLLNRFSVPTVDSALTGTGTATLTLDSDSGELSGEVILSGLTDDATAVHIHEAIAGITGSVIVTLELGENAAIFNIPTNTVLTADQVVSIQNSEFYLNVHTAANGSGEVRGQIIGDNQEVVRVVLNGENEEVPVISANTGLGFLTVDSSSGTLRGNIRNTGLDDATSAHIHGAFAGDSGGALITLEQDTSDDGLWSVPTSTTLDATNLASLLAGGTYFNVHTPAVGSGEVRGQIAPNHIVVLRNELSGDQEVPAVVTVATGIGYTTVNEVTGAINANARVSAVTGNAAHIHIGSAGISGSVAVTLSESSTGFWVTDDNETLDASELTSFNSDSLYFNVHSVANGSGEIRGQITH